MAGTTAPPAATYADELHALIAAGGYWGLAPDWVPRLGWAALTRAVLLRIETGLMIECVPLVGEEQ
ncbi:hypothetical protein [Streptomyces sp. NPDC056672]|uniref:hypothetical protein n=1 Tax=Streptomyces sp. NPDC056672 TaxID=3345906 RepID=UPI00368F3F6E